MLTSLTRDRSWCPLTAMTTEPKRGRQRWQPGRAEGGSTTRQPQRAAAVARSDSSAVRTLERSTRVRSGGQTLRSKSGTAIEFVSAMPTTEQGFKRALATLNPQGCVTNPYALSLSPTYSEPQAENRGHIWRYIKGKGGFHPLWYHRETEGSSD